MSQYPNRSDNGVIIYGLPANPTIGAVAVDSADGKLKRYNGTSWTLAESEIESGVVSAQTLDNAAVADFVQTGMSLSTVNPLRGKQSALLTHQSAVNQSFKQTIVVDKFFRGKGLVFNLINRSSAYSANLTLLIYDETNAATLLLESINTDKQAFAANTASNNTISAIPSTIINYLAIGQTITGAGIPGAIFFPM